MAQNRNQTSGKAQNTSSSKTNQQSSNSTANRGGVNGTGKNCK